MAIALYASFIFIVIMGLYLIAIKEKKQLHKMLILNVFCVFLWALGYVLRDFLQSNLGYKIPLYLYISTLGVSFFPIILWYTSLIFKNFEIKISMRYLLALIIPIISNIMLWTNYHDWYYKGAFPAVINASNAGPYFNYVHIPSFYLFTLLWIFNMIVYATKNKELLFRQVIIVITGTCGFLISNLMFGFGVVTSPYWNIIGFAFMLLCYLVAMVKYNFLNIIPIARTKILDNITECFVVLNKNFEVVDFNKTFTETFKDLLLINIGDNFISEINNNKFIKITPERFNEAVEKSEKGEHSLPINIRVVTDKINKWFSIAITCIDRNKDMGLIVTIRDITQEKRREIIDVERTKLFGFAEIVEDLICEINSPLSVVKNTSGRIHRKLVEAQNSPEQILELYDWLPSRIETIQNCSDRSLVIVHKIRKQVTYTYEEERTEFELKKLIHRTIRGDAEIIPLTAEFGCIYKIDGEPEVFMLGYPNSLSKVLRNVIKNAIESYNKKDTASRVVEVNISKTHDGEQEMVTIKIKDYGAGINESLQKELFTKPFGTKNLNPSGAGVSLFFAPLIVVGKLEGSIWFESEEGVGSTFYISIPTVCRERS